MRRILTLVVAAAGLMSVVVAQDTDEIADLSSKGARIVRAGGAGRLTPPSNAGRPEIVSAFLAARRGQGVADSLVLETENATAQGPVHLRFRQRVAGLDVYGTYVKASMTRAGELVSVVENLAPPGPALLPASIDYGDALSAALRRRYPAGPADLPEVSSANNRVEFARGERFYQNPVVTRMAVPLANGRLRVGYLVETWDHENQLWHTVVNGNGRIIYEELRTASDSYRIFPNHPGVTAQTVVSGPGVGNTESPNGWVFSNTTIGNNVDAYLDRNNNNSADTNGRPVSSTANFSFIFNTSISPTSDVETQMASVTNLFYLNNVLHDKLYKHGFTEAAGNFQSDNFGQGGAGNDPVNAEAQDGGGTNNANFATPSDGSRPRMQMYIWTPSNPDRDGDVDSDIVYHEYGHGLTWRMIGGMSGPLSGAIGEGMSDTVALYINSEDDRLAEYSSNDPGGIRRHPYTNYPNTYSDVSGSSVHNDGEIYAGAMWRLRQLWIGAGLSPDSLFDRVVGGMNFTPSGPAYEDMRDGILAAIDAANDSSEGAERCQVWTAFAASGIGQGANGSVSCRGFRCTLSITESFSVPADACSTSENTAPSVTIDGPANNSSFPEGTSITFSATVTDAQNDPFAIAWASSLDAGIGTGASFNTSGLSVGIHDITATATETGPGGLSGAATVRVTITEVVDPPPGGILLQVREYKVKGVQHADLTWSGATSASVDVYRGSTKVITTANGGFHTDNIGAKGGGSYTYRVCEAGTSTCSPNVTIVF